MQGRTVLVTGATSGIGFHTAQALARMGARVVVTGRDETRGRDAVRELRRLAGHDDVDFLAVDHATLAGNRALADVLTSRYERLHVLVNNVGGLYARRWETEDGYEGTLAVNFVGTVALTERLLPLLRRSAPVRIVNVVSSAYAMWKRDPFAALDLRKGYVGIDAYARAKLLNVLWTLALARRLEGSGVDVNATNPGMAWTHQTQAITPEAVPAWRLFWPLVRWMQRRASAEAAARSSVFLASSPAMAGVTGVYFGEHGKQERLSPLALDTGNQERAWDLAATLVAGAPPAAIAKGQISSPSLPPPRRTREARARIFRVLNPLMRVLLHLPIRPMQERLLLLAFKGRKSGQRRTVPLSYVEDSDGSLLVPGGGAWKWNLAGGRPVQIRLRGRDRWAQPELISDRAQIERLLPIIFAANPRAKRFIGVALGPDGTPDREGLGQALSDGFVLVRLRLGGDHRP
jgi:NAD(P)-dependent dehydrogenase (short-subunit alcohol dehydrogenase family)